MIHTDMLLPPRIEAAMQYLGYCHAVELGASESSVPNCNGRDLSADETVVKATALRLIDYYMQGSADELDDIFFQTPVPPDDQPPPVDRAATPNT